MSETVEIGGVEFNRNDLADAVEQLRDETTDGMVQYESATSRSVIIEGDGRYDGDVYIYDVTDVQSFDGGGVDSYDQRAFTNLQYIENVVNNDFSTFVEDEFGLDTDPDVRFTGEADLDAISTQTFRDNMNIGQDTTRDLIEHDGVRVTYLNAEDKELLVGLEDTRE